MDHILAGLAFENETRNRLLVLGWQVGTTPVTGDWGADLLARVGAELLVVQCKDYGSPVGVSAIQEAHFAKAHYSASAAMVVARNGYTRAAKEAARTAAVKILTPSDLVPGCELDRTPLRRRLDAEQAAAQEELQKAERERQRSVSWQNYDLAVAKSATNKKISRDLRVAVLVICCWSVIAELYENSASLIDSGAIRNIFYTVFAALFVCYLLGRKALPPVRPAGDRRGAIIKCDICLNMLRVDLGRVGHVRCPVCKALSGVWT